VIHTPDNIRVDLVAQLNGAVEHNAAIRMLTAYRQSA
jgi:hypothetical protein